MPGGAQERSKQDSLESEEGGTSCGDMSPASTVAQDLGSGSSVVLHLSIAARLKCFLSYTG